MVPMMEDLLYTFKCAPLILFTTTVFPSKLQENKNLFQVHLIKEMDQAI